MPGGGQFGNQRVPNWLELRHPISMRYFTRAGHRGISTPSVKQSTVVYGTEGKFNLYLLMQ